MRVITVSFDLAKLHAEKESETKERLKTTYCSGDINEPDGDYYFNANTNADLAVAFGVIRDQLARKMYLAE